jgi:hypothetical protein
MQNENEGPDMMHLMHLNAVTLSDMSVLKEKERTYMGSWKRAGGRSAWFMLRRNMDRLITMMQPPPKHHTLAVIKKVVNDAQSAAYHPGVYKYLYECYLSEDVFAKIMEDPSGRDGSMLACLRDLRRYCILVEAEMIARGVVVPEGDILTKQAAAKSLIDWAENNQPGTPEDGGHHDKENPK